MLYITGPTLRCYRVTIRLLAQRLAITMQRVRVCRQSGLDNRHVARDWLEVIAGEDPDMLVPQSASSQGGLPDSPLGHGFHRAPGRAPPCRHAFQWLRVLYRGGQERPPYDESMYLQALKRRSPSTPA